MASLKALIETLKDPLLVVRFQQLCGIKSENIVADYLAKNSLHHNTKSLCDDIDGDTSKHSNGIHHRSDNSATCGITKSEKSSVDPYSIIGNKFFYYIFLLGTALGDEIFYSCFFSFWFWNIDGAVGRRIMLCWALCMYIGNSHKTNGRIFFPRNDVNIGNK